LQGLKTAADEAAEATKRITKAQDDAKSAIEAFIPNQDLLNVQLDVYQKALDAGKIDLIEFTELTENLIDAQNRLNPLWVEAQRVIEDLKTPTERLNEETARFDILLQKNLLTQEQYAQAVFNTRKELGLLGPEFDRQTALADGFASAITDSIGQIIKGGTDIKTVFADLASSIAELILQITILEPLEAFLRNSFGGTGSEREQTGQGGGGPLQAITGALAGTTPGAVDAGGQPFDQAAAASEGIVEGFAKGGTGFFAGLQTNFQGILGGFGGIFEGLIGAIGGLFGGGGGGGGGGTAGAIIGIIGAFAGAMAQGGSIGRGQFGIVGEAGPEIVTGPGDVARIQDIGSSRAGGSSDMKEIVQAIKEAQPTVINVNEQDPESLLAVNKTRAGVREQRNFVTADARKINRTLGRR